MRAFLLFVIFFTVALVPAQAGLPTYYGSVNIPKAGAIIAPPATPPPGANLVALGDSITYGAGSTPGVCNVAPPNDKCWVDLLRDHYSLTEQNFGIPGSTLESPGSNPLISRYSTAISPYCGLNNNVFTILIGVNDLSYMQSTPATYNITTFQSDLSTIVNAILSCGTLPQNVVIVGLTYRGTASSTNFGYTQLWQAIIAAQASVAAQYDVRFVTTADQMAIQGGSSLMYDGTHPNDAGHALIAQLVENAFAGPINTIQNQAYAAVANYLANATIAGQFVENNQSGATAISQLSINGGATAQAGDLGVARDALDGCIFFSTSAGHDICDNVGAPNTATFNMTDALAINGGLVDAPGDLGVARDSLNGCIFFTTSGSHDLCENTGAANTATFHMTDALAIGCGLVYLPGDLGVCESATAGQIYFSSTGGHSILYNSGAFTISDPMQFTAVTSQKGSATCSLSAATSCTATATVRTGLTCTAAYNNSTTVAQTALLPAEVSLSSSTLSIAGLVNASSTGTLGFNYVCL